MDYQLRDSVRAYVFDPMVSAGVDALLGKADKLVPDLRWTDIRPYHEAWIAAQRVKADWAITLCELWDVSWSSSIPRGWDPVLPDDQVHEDKDASPHPSVCWTQSWYGRLMERDDAKLWLYVDLDVTALSVGVALEGRKASNLLGTSIARMTYDKETQIHWQSDPAVFDDGGAVDLRSTIELCMEVKSVVEAQA